MVWVVDGGIVFGDMGFKWLDDFGFFLPGDMVFLLRD